MQHLERPTIAYIEQRFPSLTTTFVYREVFALRDCGFKVETYSIHRPKIDTLSAESLPLAEQTTYLKHLPRRHLFRAHLHWLIRRPQSYFRTLRHVLKASQGKPEKRRAFLHFIGGVMLAYDSELKDVQHIHAHFSTVGASLALVAANIRGISFSFTAHNSLFIEHHLLRLKIEEARFIAAISNYTHQYIAQLTGNDPAVATKTHIVRCGIDTNKFRPVFHHPTTPPTVIAVAQLVERKGLRVLIEACSELAMQGQPFKCRIVGSGEQREELQQLISTLGLQKQVQLMGAIKQEALRQQLAQATVFALPCIVAEDGDVDGIPVALMEAMAIGVPVVSTAVSGIPDLIEDGVTGRLVPEKDATALALVLGELLNDLEQCERLREAARQFVTEQFNIEQTSRQIAALFTEQIGNLLQTNDAAAPVFVS